MSRHRTEPAIAPPEPKPLPAAATEPAFAATVGVPTADAPPLSEAAQKYVAEIREACDAVSAAEAGVDDAHARLHAADDAAKAARKALRSAQRRRAKALGARRPKDAPAVALTLAIP